MEQQRQYHVRFRLPYDATDLEDRETIVLSTFEPTANRIRHWCPALRNADILEITPMENPQWITRHCDQSVSV